MKHYQIYISKTAGRKEGLGSYNLVFDGRLFFAGKVRRAAAKLGETHSVQVLRGHKLFIESYI